MSREEYELRKLAEKERAFRDAIKPLIDAKVRVLSYKMPRYIVRGTTVEMCPIEYTPQEQEMFATIDTLIESVRKQLFP